MGLAEQLRAVAAEIEWLDDQGTFPRKLSWLAARAREIADIDSVDSARALLDEPDFKAAQRAAEADGADFGKTWSGRAIMFLRELVLLLQEIDARTAKPLSVGAGVVVTETRAERTDFPAPPNSSIITFDDE